MTQFIGISGHYVTGVNIQFRGVAKHRKSRLC
jgi:hypothetical protein